MFCRSELFISSYQSPSSAGRICKLHGLFYGKVKIYPRRKLACCCLCLVLFHMTGRQVLIYPFKIIPLYPVLAMKSYLNIYLECKGSLLGGNNHLNVEQIGCTAFTVRFLSPSPTVGDGGTENLRNVRREICFYMAGIGGRLHAVAVKSVKYYIWNGSRHWLPKCPPRILWERSTSQGIREQFPMDPWIL